MGWNHESCDAGVPGFGFGATHRKRWGVRSLHLKAEPPALIDTKQGDPSCIPSSSRPAIPGGDAAGTDTEQRPVAGNVHVGGGRVRQQTLSLKGSGDYASGALDSRTANVSIEGSGNATVRAVDQLVVRIGGTGDLRFYGNPRVDAIVRGAGSVSRADDL